MLIYSGRFSPLHTTHINIANHAADYFKQQIFLELSLTNVDKLNCLNYIDPAKQIVDAGFNLIINKAATFYEKSFLYPNGTVFVVGTDTIDRICNEKYYGDADLMNCQHLSMSNRGFQFAVYPRLGYMPDWLGWKMCSLALIDMTCRGERYLPTKVSSTELRNKWYE